MLAELRLPEFRMVAEAAEHEIAQLRGTPRQVLLTAQEFLDVNVEVDLIRSHLLEQYRRIDRPISLIMAVSMAGADDARNHLWQAGVERLVHAKPQVHVFWLEAGHDLVLTHAPDIARIIRSRSSTLAGC